MGEAAKCAHFYVIKAEELPALYYLDEQHPRPIDLQWINRGTDQVLRRTTVEMLLRTLFVKVQTKSVQKLHSSAGLRAYFRSEIDRTRFAKSFSGALEEMDRNRGYLVTALFDCQEIADEAVHALKASGVPEDAIALLWRASEYLAHDYKPLRGHDAADIAGTITGAGMAGAVLGVGMLMIPGIGPVAVAGAMAGAAIAPVAAVSSVIGATGGAIAKMLTDHDVDGVAATLYEREIKRGKVFLSVNTQDTEFDIDAVSRILADHGGQS